MKHLYISAIAVALLGAGAAHAQEGRLSDSQYLSASRCVAYSALEQLQGVFSTTALQAAMSDNRSPWDAVTEQAETEQREIRLAGRRAGQNEARIQRLRARQDSACSRFIDSGLVSRVSG